MSCERCNRSLLGVRVKVGSHSLSGVVIATRDSKDGEHRIAMVRFPRLRSLEYFCHQLVDIESPLEKLAKVLDDD